MSMCLRKDRIDKSICFFLFMCFFYLFIGPSGADEKKYILFLVLDSEGISIKNAIKEVSHPKVYCHFLTVSELLKQNEELKELLQKADLLLLDIMDKRILELLKSSGKGIFPKKIFSLRGAQNKEELEDLGLIFDDVLIRYYSWPSSANLKNLILKLIHDHVDHSTSYQAPEGMPEMGIYHPGAGRLYVRFQEYYRWYTQKRPSISSDLIGISFYGATLANGQSGIIDELIHILEQEGLGVVPVFGPEEVCLQIFKEAKVRAAISFTLKFSSALSGRIRGLLEELGVPIVNGITMYEKTLEEWEASPKGIGPFELAYTIANPEISGLIEPSLLGGKVEIWEDQHKVYVHRLIHENAKQLVQRVKKWVLLQKLPNFQKRIAILYYNHNPGRQDIGASYLNLFQSLRNVLITLKKEGYELKEMNVSEEHLKELILTYGRNIGSWAQGELRKLYDSKNVVVVPLSQYMEWYEELPQDFRRHVEEQWGRPEESKIMYVDQNFIIPAIKLGNVVIMPEPSRGTADDPVKLYHSPSLYPHHQYIAAYLWLKKVFDAHAMVHFGTHATHEWQPGKEVGLSNSCTPEVLITDIPNIYPYIMDNIGEGVQAKRRGRGVIIDHLIPPLKRAGLYQEYAKVYEKVQGIKRSQSLGSPTLELELQGLNEDIRALGLVKELRGEVKGLEDLERVEDYLLEMRDTLIPYGLHTFGTPPKEEAALEMIEAIGENFPAASKRDIKERLMGSGVEEMKSFLRALEGGFVPPGEGNDPVRNLDALPTGRNFYGFNPQKIPTKEAYEAGKRAAEELIKKSIKDTGKFPKKVAIVLWAVETMRNGGVNESTILSLMGIEPIWDGAGKVVGVRPIPGRVLKRPRIDVLINPSGLYRDLFPDKLLLLDRAVKMARVQTDVENLIAENSLRIKEGLIKRGLREEEAQRLSELRIFGEASGTYGTGISEVAGLSSVWESEGELYHVYKMRVGNVFGEGVWGKEAGELFEINLGLTDHVLHSFSSNIFAAIDNDDVYDYVGGLYLAVKKVSGKAPRASISFHRNLNESKVENLVDVLSKELRTRYLNPRWIEGMVKEGFGGARAMAKFVEYFWGFQVTTPESVNETQWEQIFRVYVEDQYGLNIKEFFKRHSPWAYQSITARMLEAIRKGYWDASYEIRQKLSSEYAMSVVESGVACCDHTCNNPFLNQMVLNLISVPGLLSPDLVANFQASLKDALGKTLEVQTKEIKALKERVKELVHKNLDAPGRHHNGLKEVKGYKFVETMKPKEDDSYPSSGIQLGLTLFVLAVIGLLLAGFANGLRKGPVGTFGWKKVT